MFSLSHTFCIVPLTFSYHHYHVRCQAVKVFYSLSKDLQLRHKFIFNEKAVSLLVLMGRETFVELTYGRSIARVFRSLCKEAPITLKLVREGIVVSLQWLLQYNDPAIRHLCTESLCYLFEHDEVVKELVYGASGTLSIPSQCPINVFPL